MFNDDKEVEAAIQAAQDAGGQPEPEYEGPQRTRLATLLQRWLKPVHRHVDTGGFDPYAGERWTFKLAGRKVVLANVISFSVKLGKHTYMDPEGCRRMGPVQWLVVRLGKALFKQFEQYRYWREYESEAWRDPIRGGE